MMLENFDYIIPALKCSRLLFRLFCSRHSRHRIRLHHSHKMYGNPCMTTSDYRRRQKLDIFEMRKAKAYETGQWSFFVSAFKITSGQYNGLFTSSEKSAVSDVPQTDNMFICLCKDKTRKHCSEAVSFRQSLGKADLDSFCTVFTGVKDTLFFLL